MKLNELSLMKNIIQKLKTRSKSNQNFSLLGSIIEISPQGPIISFMFDDSIRDVLGFNARTLYEEYTPSSNPADILSFDNIFLECDIAQGMIFKGRKSNIIHNWTMTVDSGYKYVENLLEVLVGI